MFPKYDYFGVKQLVKWDAPGTLRPPQRSSQTNEPRTIVSAVFRAVLHLQACIVGRVFRQRGRSCAGSMKSDASIHRTPKAFPAKFIRGDSAFRESSPRDESVRLADLRSAKPALRRFSD